MSDYVKVRAGARRLSGGSRAVPPPYPNLGTTATRREHRRPAGGVDARRLREFALSLPGAEEYGHGGRPSFRVRSRARFASGLDEDGIGLVPGEEAIRETVAEWPHACAEGRHGPRLVPVRVGYPALPDELVMELVPAPGRTEHPPGWSRRTGRHLHDAPSRHGRRVAGGRLPHRSRRYLSPTSSLGPLIWANTPGRRHVVTIWHQLQAGSAAFLAAVQERRAPETPWRNAASASG
jgi:hypothetical protein